MEFHQPRCATRGSGKERDIIQVHSCSFQDGTALVTQRMRRQCWKPHFFPHPFYDFIKSANGERAARVTRGLRQKNRSKILALIGSNEGATIPFQIATYQVQNAGRDGNISHPSTLRNFWPDGDKTTSPVDVIDPQGHEFFSSQCSIVGKQDHRLGPGVLVQDDVLYKTLPRLIRRYPG